jgi:hypothetical protein
METKIFYAVQFMSVIMHFFGKYQEENILLKFCQLVSKHNIETEADLETFVATSQDKADALARVEAFMNKDALVGILTRGYCAEGGKYTPSKLADHFAGELADAILEGYKKAKEGNADGQSKVS